MPSKPFYSLEEVCQKLGKTQDEVKALVREGRLREFRDAGKIFFKSDDIDNLAAGLRTGSSPASEDAGEIQLEPVIEPGKEDSGIDQSLSALVDSSGGTSIIGLEPLPEEEKKEDTVITASGIGVFDEDELEVDADPMAKTQITTGAVDDQVTLEGAGSGSGLLDLAREADDTALGADLLDEIYPGEEEAAPVVEEAPTAPARAEAAPAEEPALEEVGAGEVVVPVTLAAGDPAEGIFAGLLVGALVLLGLAGSVVAGAVQGYLPDYGRFLGNASVFYFFLGGSVLTVGIGLAAGWFIAKALLPRRR
jgi:hypothetical protein